MRTAAALQSRISQAHAHSRAAAALMHLTQPNLATAASSAYESRNRQKVVTSPIPGIQGGRGELPGQHHLYWQQQPSPQRRTVTPQTLPPPPSAPSSAPSSIIQLSTGKIQWKSRCILCICNLGPHFVLYFSENYKNLYWINTTFKHISKKGFPSSILKTSSKNQMSHMF